MDESVRVQTAIAAGFVGAAVAVICGRERTRFDNMAIGGLFTGFAAYRDPRAQLWQTLMVASIEGAIWGVTDRIVPQIKDALLAPPPETDTGAQNTSAQPA